MNNMNAIRWVFFDIGSTLVDEEEGYRAMHTADFKLHLPN
jgi:FMN phosphatase YigB (HAD superfamily)